MLEIKYFRELLLSKHFSAQGTPGEKLATYLQLEKKTSSSVGKLSIDYSINIHL